MIPRRSSIRSLRGADDFSAMGLLASVSLNDLRITKGSRSLSPNLGQKGLQIAVRQAKKQSCVQSRAIGLPNTIWLRRGYDLPALAILIVREQPLTSHGSIHSNDQNL